MKKEGLVYELIEKEKKERTGKLDLSNIVLEKIPNEITELPWLQILDISCTKISDIRPLEKLTLLKSLYISSNQISNLSSLEKLTGLRTLYLSSNQIRDCSFLQGLTQLESLYLEGNQISDCSFLEKLMRLKKLELGRNQIIDCSFLQGLNQLEELYLDKNQISDYGFLVKLTNLKSLELSRNQISDCSFLAKLVWLKHLRLSSNQINDLHAFMNLTSLEYLDLGFNEISDIRYLENLSLLHSLNLQYNQISDARFVGGISKLRFLDLSNNKIADISFLEKLTHLHTLLLRSNQISDVSYLGNLSHLIHLDLNSNRIRDISVLEKLSELETINLSSNQICEISSLKTFIVDKRLHLTWGEIGHIILKDNPLIEPPFEIVDRGQAAVFDYLSKLEKEKVKLYESKMLFVGQGEVGKTWLQNRLVTGKTPADGETTEGIAIKQWYFDKNEIKDFRINLWDFGGQEIYHATHQFFLSKRSLYLFIWDARKEQDIITSFDYWLNIISLLSNNAPIIVVMNKCDERTKAIEEETLKNKFKNIVGFHKVSAKDGTGIEYLKDDIQRHILSLPQVGNTLPKVWNDIRNELEQLDKHCISNTEYKGICLKYGLNAKDAEFIGDYYHDVGVFLHFRENHILNDILFLNPEWATNAVYKIIDTKEVANALGKFNFSQLKAIWHEYDEDKFVYLIELMKRFELCFQLGNSENYIVPELLRPEYTELEWDYTNNLRFEYKYTFMPAGIITRFITRQHRLIKDELYWRNGLIICKNLTEALIISEPLKRKIRIWIRGDEAKELLFLIRLEIEDIHESLNFPEVKKMYPCNCNKCSVSDNPHFFGSDMLVNFRIEKIETAQCQVSGKMINIEELRGAVMSKTDIALETIMEIGSKNEGKLNEMVQLLETIKSNQPDKETALDSFFKIIKLDFGVINAGELLKRILKYKDRKFI